MVLPRSMARANRRVTNRVLRPLATTAPGLGVITHVGRTSGRRYRTPLLVFAAPDGYVIALTYGTDTDWVRNVVAAGGADLQTRRRRVSLTAPRIVHDERRSQVPRLIRPVLRLIGVTDFLRLTAGPAGPPGPGARLEPEAWGGIENDRPAPPAG